MHRRDAQPRAVRVMSNLNLGVNVSPVDEDREMFIDAVICPRCDSIAHQSYIGGWYKYTICIGCDKLIRVDTGDAM